MRKILSTFAVFVFSFGWVMAWNGLIAQNGDLLNLSKWNEMVNLLNSKLSSSDIIAGNWVTLTSSGAQVIIDSAWGNSTPYISTQNQIIVSPNTTQNISISGQNIAPDSQLEISWFDGTINASYGLSPTELFANITTGSTSNTYNLVINNNGVKSSLWPNSNNNLLNVIAPVLWNWSAGNYTETFESNSLGSWSNVAGLDSNLTVQQWTTPSTGTWPNQASTGNYYVFAETSNPNYPNKTFWISTDNFRQAQSISFDYHMHGATMGDLEVQTLYNWVWTSVFTLSGQQQVNQTDAWLNSGNIDLSTYLVEEIRFIYTSGSNYTWDMALDNISIVSQ